MDWRSRQMWLFVLCQERSTDVICQPIGRVCEKIAQNVAQTIFWVNINAQILPREKLPQTLGHLGNFLNN
jgi:hypothetical protein